MLPQFLITKSKAAFLFSYDRLAENNKRLYFWTFTWRSVHSDWFYYKSWAHFQTLLKARVTYQFQALRVYEPNQRGGIHVHMVCNERISVWMVKRLALAAGMGRENVRFVRSKPWWDKQANEWKPADREYLTKYLSKEFGARGGRQWAAMGDWSHCKVKDVEVVSTESNFLRLAYKNATGGHGEKYKEARCALALALRNGDLSRDKLGAVA